MAIKEDQLQWFTIFFFKSSGSGVAPSLANTSATKPNYQLANELHRQIIKKRQKKIVYSSFRDNIWGIDLTDMQSLTKYNIGIRYLLCAFGLFSKYARIVPLKYKRAFSIINPCQKKESQKHANQIKYGSIKVVNVKINFFRDF